MTVAVDRSQAGSTLGEPTLLFTDIEGSTRLLTELGDARYAQLLALHHELIRVAISRHSGVEQGTEGDSFFATFSTAADGVAAALAAQHDLSAADWPGGAQVRVRMGLHSGPVALVDGNLVGMAIHAAARIEASAHGGQVVVSSAVADQLPEASEDRAPMALRSLGWHRLRGITGRVQLFQVDVPGAEREFPPLASEPSDAVPPPRFLSEFVGREEERAAVAGLLERSRVVTITGPPGVGKTRLAASVVQDQPDVAFVALAPVEDPSQVADRVAAALGVRAAGEDDALEVLVRRLQDVPFVLVVDNCEHVIDEAARAVAELVARTDLRVLATSREPLAIEGEVVWPLQPLEQAEELFVVRARAADASTVLSPDDPRVIRICDRLDRLPLAVELAAAQVGRMPLDELATRLDGLVGQLRSGRRDAPSRHRTLRGAIEWSVRLLDPPERAAFRRLGVMRGPFELAMAEAVTDEPAEVIATLHERSLLVVDGQGPSDRLRMLQTVRSVALDLLAEAGEAEEAAAVHAAAFADRARARFHGLPTRLETLRAVDEDLDNYVSATEWMIEHDPSNAVQLAVDLEALWSARISPSRALPLLEEVLDRADDAPAPLRSSVLIAVADLNRSLGRLSAAREAAQQAVDLSADHPTQDRYAAAVVLGQIVAVQGELDLAQRLFEERLAISRDAGDVQGVVGALRELANVAIERTLPEQAMAPLDEAIGLAVADEDSRWMLGILAADRARAALALGRVDEARAEYESALPTVQALGIGRGIAGMTLGLAQVERASGNLDAARPLVREAFRYYRDEGDTGGAAHALVEAGLQRAAAGDHARAVRLLAAAEATRRRIEIATPGSEERPIRAAWSAAEQALGAEAVERLTREARSASIQEVADLV